MLEQLIAFDKDIFLAINAFHVEFFDYFFWAFTQKSTWIPFYLILLFVLYKWKKKEALWIALGLFVTILLADQISSSILKPLVARLRPSQEPSLRGLVHLIDGYMGGKFGFVSSHAANSFGLALFTSLLFKNKRFTLLVFIWALLNSYSRIYVGVHYPLDIICGALVGLISAFVGYGIVKKYKQESLQNKPENKLSLKPIYWVLGASVLIISIYAGALSLYA